MLIKENNPWVGLASYKRQDAARFFGREKETRKLSELIQANYCTILYGQSGAGKTSLIQAGVCPLLSDMQFLPIPIKLDHSGTVSYARQIMDRVREEIRGIDGEIEFPIEIPEGVDDRSRAWLFFHTANFWNGQNYRITPALFIDQFEELFNLTSDLLEVQAFFDLVDELLQMVPPERVSEYFERNNIRLPYREKPAFRLLLSLREDFLARLEDYSYSIPALRRNRVGLASMNGQQALDVIMNPMPGLVERDAALRILSKVTAQEVHDDPYYLEKLPVDSCILSLFCTEIYNRAAESGKDGITQDIIDQFGGNIIQTFYERNMEGISTASARYLESHLLTTNGFRNTVALEDLVPDHVKMDELRRLEENRIVRIETMNGTQRVEFTHDVLCKVATNHRKSSNEKNERRQETRKRFAYWAESVLHVGLVVCFFFSFRLRAMDFLRNYIPAALVISAFILFFLLRLGHHSNRFKSPLLMAASAIFGWMPAFLFTSALEDLIPAILILSYGLSGTVFPFIELARQRRSQNGDFIRNCFHLTKDRPRWTATLAFLLASFGMACLFAHREINGTLSFLLLAVSVPLLLEVFCFFFPEKTDARSRCMFGLLAEGGILLLVASQYTHTRVWYYIAWVILALSCFLLFRKLRDQKILVKILSGLSAWVVLALLLPNFTLGYNPRKLGSMARVPHGAIATYSKSFPNLLKVKNKDGEIGAMGYNDLVLPTQFEDILTYAKPKEIDAYSAYCNDGYSANGSLPDLDFFVKEKREKSFIKTSLSQFPTPHNRISQSIADDYLAFLRQADSIFHHTIQVGSSSITDPLLETISDDFNYGWVPMKNYYDPDIQLFLAHHFKDQPELCWKYARNHFINTGAYSLSERFRHHGSWDDEKNYVLRTILFSRFYDQTHIIPNGYSERFVSEIKQDSTFRYLLNKLLDSPADSALQTILDTPELRRDVYYSLFNNYERKQNRLTLLSLQNPQVNDFVYRLMELEDEDSHHVAYYSLFLGNLDKAKQISRKALQESGSDSDRSQSVSTLIPTLFLKGEMEECRSLLERYAFYPSSVNGVLINQLYHDLDLFKRYGIMPQDEQREYRKLLQEYNDDIFRGKDYWELDDEGKIVFFFDSCDYIGNSDSGFLYDRVDLFANGKRIASLDTLFVPISMEDSPAAIMVLDRKKGFIDRTTGQIIYPVSADHAWFFSEGRAFIEEGNIIRVINTDGQPAFEKTFVDPRDYDSPDFMGIDFVYHDGVAPMIDETGRMGLIDTLGNWVIAPEYDYVYNPDYLGRRHLLKDNKLFLMKDTQGLIIQPSHPLIFYSHGAVTLWDPSVYRRPIYFQPIDKQLQSISGKGLSQLLLSYKDCNVVSLFQKESVTWFSTTDWDMNAVLDPEDSSFVTYHYYSSDAYQTDIATKRTSILFRDEDQSYFRLFVISKDGKKAASAHENGKLRIWNMESGECTASSSSFSNITGLDISPDGSIVIAATWDGAIIYWQLDHDPVKLYTDSSLSDVKFSHSGNWFVSGASAGDIIIWDKYGKQVKRIQTGGDALYTLAISPDDRKIASLELEYSYYRIPIHDVQSGEYEGEFTMDDDGSTCLLWLE